MSGVNALENYQKAPTGSSGVERDTPLHNRCSHAADAFRTFAEAYEKGLVAKEGAVTLPVSMTASSRDILSDLALGAEELLI